MNVITEIRDQITVETDRLTLRPIRQSDAGLITMYAGDIRVSGPTRSIPNPLPPGATEAFIETALSPGRVEDIWVLDGLSAGLAEVVGLIGLKRLDRKQSEIGYWLAPAFWKMGLAREAVKALLAANPQNANRIFAEVFQDNTQSAKVLIENEFEYLGDAESYCVARHRTIETWTYSRCMKN
ncbi:MAG: GNAT family N-acetyltransferase [Planktomarina sp.]